MYQIQTNFPINQIESTSSKVRRFFTWLMFLIFWSLTISFLYLYSNSYSSINDSIIVFYIFIPFSYLIYIILSFCSQTFSYLNNINQSSTIHNKMNSFFTSPINITFHVECYHYETHYHYDSKGNRRSETRRVTTYVGSQNFIYYSWRDVSGIFLVDSSEAVKNENIIFVKLQLDKEYSFFDEFTRNDFNVQQSTFYMSNRWRDQYMSTHTTTSIPGMDEFNLVRVSDKKVFMFGVGWFVLFTLLTLGQFYKFYVDNYCSRQYFKVKKILSTRINIADRSFDERFKVDIPSIQLNGKLDVFDFKTETLHNTPALPDENDLLPSENNKEWKDNNPDLENINNNFK